MKETQKINKFLSFLIISIFSFFFAKNITCSPLFPNRLFKYHAGHCLVNKLMIVVFSKTDKSCMIAQFSHCIQVIIHVMFLTKQKITKYAVYGKYSGNVRKISLNTAYRILCNLLVILNL